MEFNQLGAYLADYGFPMVLSWYLLLRMESRLDKLCTGIENLNRTISLQGAATANRA